MTMEALRSFRHAQRSRPAWDPRPLPYLWDDGDQQYGAFNIAIEALLHTYIWRRCVTRAYRRTVCRSAICTISIGHRHRWSRITPVAAEPQPGDIFGSGTISAPEPSGFGCMRELSDNETKPQQLPTGETRIFAENGDDIILRARAECPGYSTIGFGHCWGRVIS